jgi:CTP:molybdopterin cytidylyltransferase MocA
MGRPKALLPLEGRTFLEVLADRLVAAVCAPILLVLGGDAEEIERAVDCSRLRVVRNPDPDRGQLSSILCGLDALGRGEVEGVFLAPVDCPRVRAETLLRMTRALPGRPLVVPVYAGRRGHPALFSTALFPALRAAPVDVGARAVVHATADREELEVDDPAVLDDFDEPGQLA